MISYEPIISPQHKVSIFFLALAITALSLFLAPTAPAIEDCHALTNIPDYKIAVDEVSLPAASAPGSPSAASKTASPTVLRLTADLQTQVEEITVEEGGAIIPVPCVGRRPLGAVDFNQSVVELLNDRNVVIEIWGSIDTAGGNTGQQGQLQFVLVPVRYYEHFKNNSQFMDGVYVIVYAPMPAGSALALFERSNELRASVALSMALKKIKEGRNEQALKYLCKAETFLKQPDRKISAAKKDALLQYTRGLETLTLPADPNKAASLLSPQAKANVCAPPAR